MEHKTSMQCESIPERCSPVPYTETKVLNKKLHKIVGHTVAAVVCQLFKNKTTNNSKSCHNSVKIFFYKINFIVEIHFHTTFYALFSLNPKLT